MTQENESRLMHAFPRGEGEEVQMALRKYKGRYYFDLRVWYQPEGDSTFKPTKKGISLRPDQLGELRKGLERTWKALETLPQSKDQETT